MCIFSALQTSMEILTGLLYSQYHLRSFVLKILFDSLIFMTGINAVMFIMAKGAIASIVMAADAIPQD